ncbi:CIA30 family protein [Polaribacter sp. Q13]|uniref:CIA30 family protein n=1 Tax=Polaribacter sp. Q13 TaxID=2806551 RepID=UPI00193B347F|nr:CIA30 family protein [Polaribacter sp. Q13]QVY66153.1 CIA30 family protein [Polaribacter sp. Q13]
MESLVVFNLEKNSPDNWKIINDAVMGGKSLGSFYFNEKGNCVFEGNVSLENNGGFSLLRYRFAKIVPKEYSKVIIRVKGDGKQYQFRIRSKVTDDHVYITYFETSNEWEDIEILLSDMYPTFRGNKLQKPNYAKESLEEIAFLIGNKRAEGFKLEIDSIILT